MTMTTHSYITWTHAFIEFIMLLFVPILSVFCFTDALVLHKDVFLSHGTPKQGRDRTLTNTKAGGGDILPIKSENPWTEESLLRKRTKFQKEEIDDFVVRDYNVELLLEGMTVGRNGIDYKPSGLNMFQKPLHLAQEAELKYMRKKLTQHVQGKFRTKRTFRSRNERFYMYWPNATVPYYINEGTYANPGKVVEVVKSAVQQMENETCLRFVRLTLQETQAMLDQGNNDFVVIVNAGGCWSDIGRIPDNNIVQFISLDESTWYCLMTKFVVHEFGHAIGMQHEFARKDRDESLRINEDNMDPWWFSSNNVAKHNTKDRTPLDYTSVMMYGAYALSLKRWIPFMETLDPDLQFLLEGDSLSYYDMGLSYYDIWNIHKAYQCAAECRGVPCENGGFRDFNCNCKCTQGLIGPTCNQVENTDICGGIVKVSPNTQTIVTLPDCSTLPSKGTICYWLLQAPDGYAITMEMLEFNLAWNDTTKRCYHWLEISYNLIGQPGPKYCGDSFPRGKITTTKFGEPNLMMLRLDTESVGGVPLQGGFKLKAQAYKVYKVKSEGCPRAPKVDHTTNDYKEVGSKNGAVVTYKCIYPYTMFGDLPSITCQADGTWSNVDRFKCKLKRPLFSCDFEKDDCNITPGRSAYAYTWKRFVVEGNAFFRVEPGFNVDAVRKAASFYLWTDFLLEPFTEYCVSMSIYRSYKYAFGSASCAVYTIFSTSQNQQQSKDQMVLDSCSDTEWTTIRGTLSTEYPFYIYVQLEANPTKAYNLDVDNIVVRRGRC